MESKIIVSKFGGTSMADSSAMLRSANICLEQESTIIVVSATSGTTDQLLKLVEASTNQNWIECETILFQLKEKHFVIQNEINSNSIVFDKLKQYFTQLETMLRGVYLLGECSASAKDKILSFGERISSLLFCEVLRDTMKESTVELIDASKLIITDSTFGKANPQVDLIATAINNELDFSSNKVFLTQGFIGADEQGLTTTLGRGGSDYSASLLAEGARADLLEIWTDVAGIATTDPRICQNAKQINEISYDEASEMAQYGAKVLHPTTITPAMRNSIPVFVGNSYDTKASGTWIKKEVVAHPDVRAITKRSKQSLLTVRTPKMLNAFGFMARIFDVFSRHQISVDCVTTSEISVAVTIEDSLLNNRDFICELKKLGEVRVESGYALVSLIGNGMFERTGLAAEIFGTVTDINIRMMSFGASNYNFNMLMKEADSDRCIQMLHQKLVEESYEDCTAR